MKVGIFYHEAQVPPAEAEELARTFISRKADAVCFTSEDEIPCVERLVVLGGDGTVLHAARKAAESGIPLVAVNYGTIGFLTEFERDEAEDVVIFRIAGSEDDETLEPVEDEALLDEVFKEFMTRYDEEAEEDPDDPE